MHSISLPGSCKSFIKPKDSLSRKPKFTDLKHLSDKFHKEADGSNINDSVSLTTCYQLHADYSSVKCVEREAKKLVIKKDLDENIKFRQSSSTKHFKDRSLNVNDTGNTSNDDELETSLLIEPALDYSLNEDGSVTCKICRETVPSRTHWYRHKYKVTE